MMLVCIILQSIIDVFLHKNKRIKDFLQQITGFKASNQFESRNINQNEQFLQLFHLLILDLRSNRFIKSLCFKVSEQQQQYFSQTIHHLLFLLSFDGQQFFISPTIAEKQSFIIVVIYIKMQECQQFDCKASACPDCESKDLTIAKCMQLVALLKKKAKRYDDSKLRESQSLSCNTVRTLPSFQEDLRARIFTIFLKQLERRQTLGAFQAIKGVGIIQGHPYQFSNGIFGNQMKEKLCQFQTSESLHEASNIKNESLPLISFPFQKSHEIYEKNRLKTEFQLIVENKRLMERVKFLEQQLEESLRRQQKQIAKKRQSLSGLVEELSEKNQIIEDLKTNIKWLQNKLGAKENGILQCMLEEDSEALRKVVFRLQNINDKLNIDLEKIKKDKFKAESQNKLFKNEIQTLKSEIKTLKEENFELQHEKLHVDASKKQLEFMSHKITGKVEKILKLEKKWSIATKSKEIMENIELENTSQNKKAVTESTDSLQTASHNHQLQQKLESLFVYLFHIDDMSFKLGYIELFDEEEKELLSAHKQKYMEKLNQSFIFKKSPRDINLNEDQDEMNPFGDSVIDAFNNDLKPAIKEHHQISDKMKLIESSVEHSKLVEKISELKERNMYIRNVILTLLKTLEIKSIKKETQGILTMLADYFEYSETERCQIYQPKSKKIFGFI